MCDDRARFLAGDGFDEEIERAALPEAAIEEFLNGGAIVRRAFAEEFVGELARLRPGVEKCEGVLPGGHARKISYRSCVWRVGA